MRKHSVFACAALVTLCASGTANAFGLSDLFGSSFKDKMAAACDNTMKERLKAPSTYKRVKMQMGPVEPATQDQFLGWDNPTIKENQQRMMDENPKFKELIETQVKLFKMANPKRVFMVIDYDAENSFGVPLRSEYLCDLVTTDPTKFTAFDAGNVRVDGLDSMDWQTEQIRKMTGN